MARLVVTGGYVVPVEPRGVVWPGGQVIIDGGRIVAVGPAGAPTLPGDVVIDATGMVVMPGFVNAHTHAAMTLMRGLAEDMTLMPWLEKIWQVEARLTGDDVYWGTLLAGIEMLASGITTFADQYFFCDDVARAVRDLGMRASISRGLIGTGPDPAASLREGTAFFERWHKAAGGRITAMLGPHAPYTCPPDFIAQVVAAAKALDAPLHIHLSETREEVDESLRVYGMSPIERMANEGLFEKPVLAAHCVHVVGHDLDILAQVPGGVAHNPVSNLKLACGVAPVTDMLARKINVGLGTDGAASAGTLDMFAAMRQAALLAKNRNGDPTALPVATVLEMATLGGARALGLGEEIGSLVPGKRADVIIVDLHRPHTMPLHDVLATIVYSARPGDVKTVIVDGEVVYAGGRPVRIDPQVAAEQAEYRARRLVAGQ